MPIQTFTSYTYSVRDILNDTIPILVTNTYQFTSDSIVFVQPDSLLRPNYFKTSISPALFDTLEQIMTDLHLDSINGSLNTKDVGMYCGLLYGLIDNKGKAVAFIPNYLKSNQRTSVYKLAATLSNLKGIQTNDTLTITNSITQILKAYADAGGPPPPLMTKVKFVPPVITTDE